MDLLKRPSTDFAAVRDGRQSMPLYIDVDLTTARSISGNNPLVLNISGNSFYSDQNILQGIATVHFQDTNLGNSSAPITVNPGFIAKVQYTQLLIENAAQPGYRLRLFYGVDVDFQPGTGGLVQVGGTVAIIDGSKARSKSGVAFMGTAGGTGVASQFTHGQLWNPAGTGKNLVVEQITISSGGGPSNFAIRPYNTALGTLIGNGTNKMTGGAVSSAELRTTNNAALLYSSIGVSMNAAANQPFTYLPHEPIIVPPGYGLNVINAATAIDVQASYEWYEDAV